MEVKTYEEMRNLIEDGDIMFFRKNTTIISRIIQWLTVSPYFHVAIAFWIGSPHGRRLMIAEAQGGTKRRIVNASFYSNLDQDVLKAPVEWSNIEEDVMSKIGITNYSYSDAIFAGLTAFFKKHLGLKIKVNQNTNTNDEICSEFINNIIGIVNRRIISRRTKNIVIKFPSRRINDRRIFNDVKYSRDELLTPAELFHQMADAGVQLRVSLRH